MSFLHTICDFYSEFDYRNTKIMEVDVCTTPLYRDTRIRQSFDILNEAL